MLTELHDHFPLRRTRVHEACGPGSTAFAAICAAQAEGPILWIAVAWNAEFASPVGLTEFLDPARLLAARVKDQTEALTVAEEALRDGSVPFVVVETSLPLTLTAGRRLQLAAEAGRSTGLCLIAQGAGSNAAETRWHCAPILDPAHSDSTPMRWELIKNKSGTLGTWHVRWDAASRRLDVVPPVGERPGSEDTPG